jgi:hypothetical protein
VNDNHGDWTAGRAQLSQWALEGADRTLIEPILPHDDVPFLVKTRHSVFYETQLGYLLRQAQADRVVLTGQVTEQCILYSALDAYVRHFDIVVARDAVAHIYEDLADAAAHDETQYARRCRLRMRGLAAVRTNRGAWASRIAGRSARSSPRTRHPSAGARAADRRRKAASSESVAKALLRPGQHSAQLRQGPG